MELRREQDCAPFMQVRGRMGFSSNNSRPVTDRSGALATTSSSEGPEILGVFTSGAFQMLEQQMLP